jgi:hypothetical protein
MMRRFGAARTASLKEESVMVAFRRSWTLASALALLGLRPDTDVSAQQSGGNDGTLDLLSGVEAICETVIALAMAAAISISLLSLSAHLNEAKALRQGGESPRQSADEHRLPSVAHVARAETASHYN